MLEFLHQHAKALQGLPSNEAKPVRDNRKRHHSNHDSGNYDSKRFKAESNENKSLEEKRDFKTCRVCNEQHPVIHCTTFKSIGTLAECKRTANKHQLCYNCLKPYHSAKEFYGDGCKRCDGAKHNSLLCPKNPKFQTVNSVSVRKEKNSNNNKKYPGRRQ